MDAIFDYKLDPAEDLYQIVGCDELSTTEQILTEYRIRALEFHPDRNFGNPGTLEKFQKLQKAKDILTDENQRKDYDLWRRSGLAMAYEEWKARKDSIKMSMHWATKTKKEPAIEASPGSTVPGAPSASTADKEGPNHASTAEDLQQSFEPRVYWTSSEGSETLRKFRNYEI